MFGVARLVVRYKVLVIGAVVAGFLLMGGGNETKPPVSPWDAGSGEAVAASSDKDSLTGRAFAVVADAAKDHAGVDISAANPARLRQATVDNWNNVGDAAKNANQN